MKNKILILLFLFNLQIKVLTNDGLFPKVLAFVGVACTGGLLWLQNKNNSAKQDINQLREVLERKNLSDPERAEIEKITEKYK
jgi:hypothetical protein